MYIMINFWLLHYRAFLVRDSTTVPNSFVLTMFAKGVSKNFQILLVSASIPGYYTLWPCWLCATVLCRWTTQLVPCIVLMMDPHFPVLTSFCVTMAPIQTGYHAGLLTFAPVLLHAWLNAETLHSIVIVICWYVLRTILLSVYPFYVYVSYYIGTSPRTCMQTSILCVEITQLELHVCMYNIDASYI